MGEELTLDNILTGDEVENLFVDQDDTNTEQDNPDKEKDDTEIDPDNLFSEQSESVGKEQDDEEKDPEKPDEQSDTSPNTYSSIAAALKEQGVFQNLDEEVLSKIKNADDLIDAMNKQIESQFDDRQKRINEALELGIEPSVIKQYENTINYLTNLTEDILADESEKGEAIRREQIYYDFINRGFSKERAEREVKKSFDNGTDIDDAKESLKSNKSFYENKYKEFIETEKKQQEEDLKHQRTQAEKIKKEILESEEYNGLKIDKLTRQKAFDNIAKPVFKDKDGNYLTAIQKYEYENKGEFLKNLGIIFTLTNGFKDFDNFIQSKVKKETKKSMRELEHVINNTRRNSDGSLNLMGAHDDTEQYSGLKLDIN